jgi:hypothetical protein
LSNPVGELKLFVISILLLEYVGRYAVYKPSAKTIDLKSWRAVAEDGTFPFDKLDNGSAFETSVFVVSVFLQLHVIKIKIRINEKVDFTVLFNVVLFFIIY